MKTVLSEASREESLSRMPNSGKVCMHVLGGARTDFRVMREARTLVEAGFTVSIVDVEKGPVSALEEELDGVHLKHIVNSQWFIPTRFKPWFLVKVMWMIWLGAWQLLRAQADIYHAHDILALPACYIAACLRRKPLILDSHELPLSEPAIMRWQRLRLVAKRVLAFLLRRCTAVITASPAYAREMQREYHLSDIELVRNFPFYRVVEKTNRLRQQLGLGAEKRIALYQGYLQPDRSLDLLVRAAKLLDQDIVIVMMGKPYATTKEDLESLIASEGVEERVKILPPVPYNELLEWTASADIGLTLFSPDYSLSIRLTLPNKLFEYLMAGLPVLTTPLDAIMEVIHTCDVGKEIPALTPEEIAAGINSMLVDDEALARMHRNALRVAKEEFYWEKERERLIALYRRVLASQSRELPQMLRSRSA